MLTPIIALNVNLIMIVILRSVHLIEVQIVIVSRILMKMIPLIHHAVLLNDKYIMYRGEKLPYLTFKPNVFFVLGKVNACIYDLRDENAKLFRMNKKAKEVILRLMNNLKEYFMAE